jgi:DNA-binding protein H-NS
MCTNLSMEEHGVAQTIENLEGMNETQLRELIQHAQHQLRELAAKRMDELQQAAREAGFAVTLTKIGEGEGRRGRRRSGGQEGEERHPRRRKKVQPKYRNPENPEETWSGRGRKPRWVEMALANDRTLEDLAIQPHPEGQRADAV